MNQPLLDRLITHSRPHFDTLTPSFFRLSNIMSVTRAVVKTAASPCHLSNLSYVIPPPVRTECLFLELRPHIKALWGVGIYLPTHLQGPSRSHDSVLGDANWRTERSQSHVNFRAFFQGVAVFSYYKLHMLFLKVLNIVIGSINIQRSKAWVPRGSVQGREALLQLGAYLLTPK